jgi:hypothetical protein
MNNKMAVAITTDIGPLWDARHDLQNLVGILGAVLYLAKPDKDDPAQADLIIALVQVQETCARCADALHDAITEGKLTDNNKQNEAAA